MMSRAIVRMWAVCGVVVVVMAAGWTAVQACDPSTKVEFDPPVDSSDVTPLVQIQVPESCGGFQPANLMICEHDLKFEEGCCEQSCKDMLTGIDSTCLGDIARAACDKGLKRIPKLLDALAQRCDDDYFPVTCPQDGASGTVNTAEPGEEASGAQETFFKPSSTPAEETEACTEETIVGEIPTNETLLASLSNFVFPASCGNFQLLSLAACLNEVEIAKGCCQKPCKDVLKPMSKKCLEDITRQICSSQSAAIMPYMRRLWMRCHHDPFEALCSELKPLDSTREASDEETLEGFDSGSKSESTPEVCDASTKVAFDPPVAAGDLGPLLLYKVPASCGGFQVIDLRFCYYDVPFKKGCCEQPCKNFLTNINPTCLTDFARVVCDKGGEKQKKSIKILDTLARRCVDDYAPFSCSVVSP